jgi:tryptophan-rich sensory protein
MISSIQTLALIELSITTSVICIWVLQKFSTNPFPFAVKLFLILLIGNILFWPLGLGMELPLVAYVRGVTGDLSIVLTLLLWSSLLPSSKPVPIAFKFAVAMIALCF